MLVISIMIIIVLLVWSRSKRNGNKNEPPIFASGKNGFRNALRFARGGKHLWKLIKKLSHEAQQKGGVLKMAIGPRTIYMISDPKDFLTVSNACLEKDAIYDFAKNWLGDGLITASISKWKIHRKLLNSAFSQRVVDSFIDVFNGQSRSLVKSLEVEVGNGPFDHYSYTRRNALETICLTALGVDFKNNSVIDNEYLNIIEKIFNIYISRIENVWLHSIFLYSFSSLRRKENEYIKVLHNITNKILKQVKDDCMKNHCNVEETNSKGPRFKSFMSLLLELSRDSNAFSDSEIREHVDTIIVSGEDTSASVVMFCMLLVGSHPRVQERIYEELKNIFDNEDRDVTKQDLSQLVYLEAVIKESMRIYPTVPIIGRHLNKDVKLRHCTLSKGRTVFMSIYGVHRHSMWGPDVKEFRPERWIDHSTIPDCPNALASFSMGRRTCIGKTYAMMSLKVTMVHICRNYMIQGDYTKMELKLEIVLKPVTGHHVTIEKRLAK